LTTEGAGSTFGARMKRLLLITVIGSLIAAAPAAG
jgi:hypothetical protein